MTAARVQKPVIRVVVRVAAGELNTAAVRAHRLGRSDINAALRVALARLAAAHLLLNYTILECSEACFERTVHVLPNVIVALCACQPLRARANGLPVSLLGAACSDRERDVTPEAVGLG